MLVGIEQCSVPVRALSRVLQCPGDSVTRRLGAFGDPAGHGVDLGGGHPDRLGLFDARPGVQLCHPGNLCLLAFHNADQSCNQSGYKSQFFDPVESFVEY